MREPCVNFAVGKLIRAIDARWTADGLAHSAVSRLHDQEAAQCTLRRRRHQHSTPSTSNSAPLPRSPILPLVNLSPMCFHLETSLEDLMSTSKRLVEASHDMTGTRSSSSLLFLLPGILYEHLTVQLSLQD